MTSLQVRDTQRTDAPGRRAPKRARPRHAIRRLREEIGIAFGELHLRYRLANGLSSMLPPMSLSTLRAALYRSAGFRIGRRASFVSPIAVIGGGRRMYSRLMIGEECLIGYRPLFNLDDTITLGRNVSVGPNVSIYTSTHLLGPASRRMNPNVITRPVVIEDGVWIGANSVILPGVTIGRGSVISAGAVVSESIPENMLAAGTPAKPTQELPWTDE